MDDDYGDLANRLFATATTMLEGAAEVAATGQSPQLKPSALAEVGRQLEAAAREVAISAQAVTIVADLSRNPRGKRPESGR